MIVTAFLILVFLLCCVPTVKLAVLTIDLCSDFRRNDDIPTLMLLVYSAIGLAGFLTAVVTTAILLIQRVT